MIATTPARTQFKRHLGQANHYLVTSLVALHHLETSKVEMAPTELRTSWNPRDTHSSIVRTRSFVQQSFLGWAVDSIDLYLSLLNRKPKFLRDPDTVSKLDGAGRSVLRKVQIVGRHFDVAASSQALVIVLITWRNNVFHELADNAVDEDSRSSLETHARAIEHDYRGLRVADLVNKADTGSSLTFKETASLISAAHHFVQAVDTAVLQNFDQHAFCMEAVRDALNDREQKTAFARKYSGLENDRRGRFVETWIRNILRFASVAKDTILACASLQREVEAG